MDSLAFYLLVLGILFVTAGFVSFLLSAIIPSLNDNLRILLVVNLVVLV